MTDRRQDSYAVRVEAAELARSRNHPDHQANGDEQRYAGAKYFMSFTKGLPHNPKTGLLEDPQDFVEFRRAIDDGLIDPFSTSVKHGALYEVFSGELKRVEHPPNNFRQWEAPTAGVVFELEGPDAQAVTMPPAPPLLDANGNPNPELVLEMAEVYELAILRDQPFNAFENGKENPEITQSLGRLNNLSYVKNQTGRPRKVSTTGTNAGKLDAQTVFRGSSPGVEVGPYLSQFLLIGNTDRNGNGNVNEGLITYGVLQIDQRVPAAKPKEDYMIKMDDYVEVQRGIRPDPENYVPGPSGRPVRRFISTPRDLATYVHYDALYEAYLNACIILLEMGTPFDPGFDHLSGVGAAASDPCTRRNAGGFALYGGPHILNLVTEVATRALKAVRFQKFNNHIRLRPEALAARIELIRDNVSPVPPELSKNIGAFKTELQETLTQIERGPGNGTNFLPMAFPEGSPMHPAYGAGHATVAGACVTILKAFFDTSAVLVERDIKDPKPNGPRTEVKFARYTSGDSPIEFRAPALNQSGNNLDKCSRKAALTLEGELNKLAANISIGRDMAGVHYFTDYYDSLRMGEEIAIGILEEQALTYSTDPFVLSVPTFDGDVKRIGRR
ncbi:vanadium-dependent haloperoxidase [Acaryochloris sp. IP29b_bin.137]|uniref:vanadium-dependent haloperoxidase n=1 Tax=Acaryochloris sp. IP29b_bin.137 TaxID=2969217 RepID=UPI002612C254|nr:vanadium-dependent haloperoxidase [Acaryochloris sp. IP29b_bin.137]